MTTKSTNTNPLVSIIMPVYNSQDYLASAVDSIIKQTYTNWELICVDDGSTDKSLEILKLFSIQDKRIKVIEMPKNRGLTYALNKALKVAKGTYIARMDSDDISMPKRLEKQVSFLLKNPDVVVVGTQCELIDEDGKVFGRKMFPTDSDQLSKMMFEVMPMQHPTIMARADIYKKEKYERQSTAEDVSLFFRFLQYGDMANIDSILFRYRIRRNSNSLKNIKKTFWITFKTRIRAIKEWGYRPSLDSIVINLFQLGVMAILPSYIVLALYESLRFSRPVLETINEDVFQPVLNKISLLFKS